MSFFTELKRRNVFRVGIAYAVAAWVLLQIVDLVLDNIAAPEWVMQVFMLALAIGFPIAIIMAWAFEMTPDGIKLETQVDRSQSITAQTGQNLNRIIIGSLVLAVIFLLIDPFENSESETPVATATTPNSANTTTTETDELDKSVAVLPFANRSTDPNDAFFAEGMHDDLLTQLAKIGSIKVISRTSVLAYKDTTLKIPQIADELGVATIVEAGIQRSGSRIRINAQLINAHTDEHLWAETYNRELTAENLFDIQAEIARSIAQALKATLSDEEEARIDRVLTKNLMAWESYQRAKHLHLGQEVDLMRAGVSEAERAIQIDPEFAAAWSLKAQLLLQQYWFFDTNPLVRDAAWDAIQSGRAIDPTLPELDIAEGYYHYWGFRDYEKALPLMEKGLAAIPNDSDAYLARGYVLRRLGNWEECLKSLRRAIELNPLDFGNLAEIGDTLTNLKRFDEAAEVFAITQAMAPNDPYVLWQSARFQFASKGDANNYAHIMHVSKSANPESQMHRFESSLFIDDYEGAFRDINDWPEQFLDSKDARVTRQMLTGLTWRFTGNEEKARPLLLAAKQEFETFLQDQTNSYAILNSLCLITGGLGDLQGARQRCADSLLVAPVDAYVSKTFKFYAAAGLALAGDSQAATELLNITQSGELVVPISKIIYHPAFDDIRQDAAYIELINTYGPENPQK